MSDQYDFYQGAVLREIVVSSSISVSFRPFVHEGRISAFIVNGLAGVFIKHSGKRMSPWPFTFTLDQASDLLDLEAKYPDSFVVFACETDGFVTLDVGSLHEIVSFAEKDKAWVRIERPPRSQYAVSGNKAALSYKVPRGVEIIHEAIRKRVNERLRR